MFPMTLFKRCSKRPPLSRPRAPLFRRSLGEGKPDGEARPPVQAGLGNLAVLNNELLLRIFELCDASSLEALMDIPVTAWLIQKNKVVIFKRLMREQHHLDEEDIQLGFICDAIRATCGGPCGPRHIYPVLSLPAVFAVEARDLAVENIMDSMIFHTRMDSRWPRLDNLGQRKKMRDMVREGIRICDRLADLEGGVVTQTNAMMSRTGSPLPLISYEHESALITNNRELGNALIVPPPSEMHKRTFVRWQLRGIQGAYLVSCTTYQLYCLALLLRLANERTSTQNRRRETINQSYTYPNAINEAILRHGSWFLTCWGSTMGNLCHGRYEYAIAITIAAGRELLSDADHESGIERLGGKYDELTVVLDSELRRRLDYGPNERGLDIEVLVRIDEMIRGPQTVLPMTWMFAETLAWGCSNSDASSTLSGSTAYSYTKDPVTGVEEKEKRRGLRQKARDVVHDLGAPPTRRQDAKEGKHTSNFAEVPLIGDGLSNLPKV
ncbi:peroxisomal targeting signal receptor [Purpureocillium lavendulum]|uniref:Peroxisomal targeting signal receptor n=1 Tax=Purpureocillium lavendulum TaxID=1247861 RepID=A0AB34G249_9HYPO|nr:peroxisomal targeting signal receptor [Purpureocillium lavendulum]